MAKESDLALQQAMMADLGIHRVEELPMEDGNHGNHANHAPVPRYHNALQAQVGSRAGPSTTSQRPRKTVDRPGSGVTNIWQAAIDGGAFDDADAEAVKGLDDLGDETGRLYASRHGSGGMPAHPELHGRLARTYHHSGRELPPNALLHLDKKFAVSRLGIVQLDGDGPILSLNKHKGAVAAAQPRVVQAANPAQKQVALRPAATVTPNTRAQQVSMRLEEVKTQSPRPQKVPSGPSSPARLHAPPQPENYDHSQRMGTLIEQNSGNIVFEAPVSYVAQRRGKKESPGQVTLHQSRPPVANKGIFRLFVVDKLFAEHRISDWHNFALDIDQALLTVRFINREKENTRPKEKSKGEDNSLEYSMKFKSVDGVNGANHFLETVNSVWADQEVPILSKKPVQPKAIKETRVAVAQSTALPVTHWQTRLAAPADFDPFSVTIGSPRQASSLPRESNTAARTELAKPTAANTLPNVPSAVALRPPPGLGPTPSLVRPLELKPPPGFAPSPGLKQPPGLKPPPGFGPSPGLGQISLRTQPPGLAQPSIAPQSNQQPVLERVPSFDLLKPLFGPPNGVETSVHTAPTRIVEPSIQTEPGKTNNTQSGLGSSNSLEPDSSRETDRGGPRTQTTEEIVNVLRQIAAVRDAVSSSGKEAREGIDMTAVDAAARLLQSLISGPLGSLGSGQVPDSQKKEDEKARRVQYSADEMMAYRSNAVRPPHWLSELRFLPARSGLDKYVPRRPISPMGWESPARPAPGIQEQITRIVESANEIELRKEALFPENTTIHHDMPEDLDSEQPKMSIQTSVNVQVTPEAPSQPPSAGLSASKWANQDARIEHPNSFAGAPGAWPESSYMNDLMQLVVDPPADAFSSNLEMAGLQESMEQSLDMVRSAIPEATQTKGTDLNVSVPQKQAISEVKEEQVPTPPVRGLKASRWCL